MRRLLAAGRTVASLVIVALLTVALNRGIAPQPADRERFNPTTVALSYLVVILLIAMRWGLAESTAASVGAVICFNFFFLPPVGTFTIADPQNWVAFVAFLITAILTSQLSSRARRRTVEAVDRQRDLERLYAVSRALLLDDSRAPVGAAIARHIAEGFAARLVGVYDRRSDTVSWAGEGEFAMLEPAMRHVAEDPGVTQVYGGMLVMPIMLGTSSVGSLAMSASGVTDPMADALANLAAIGIERARAREATAQAEAAQQSGELRAAILDALAHEFKTPLTSMKAAASALTVSSSLDEAGRELATIVDEDCDRLQALISDVVAMLRVDAGQFTLRPERLQVRDLVAFVINRFHSRLEGHEVVTRVAGPLTVDADRELLGLALRQLMDNALKYSPPSSLIEIAATGNGRVDITVRNTGSVIPVHERARLFDRFYRGAGARRTPGTGMGLAIAQQIARAHRGQLTVSSAPETGTAFTLSVPREGVHA